MGEKKLTRREAMSRLTKLLAMAAGLSTTHTGDLFAQIQRPTQEINMAKLANIKTLNEQAKAIKILIIGRRDVFVNEFGRNPIFEPGNFAGKSCTNLFSPGMSNCSEQGNCSGNNCGEQTCGKLKTCDSNNCGSQSCPNLIMPGNTNLFSSDVLNRLKTDPFVGALYREFNVTTSQALSQKLQSMVRQRRVEIQKR